MSMFEIYVILMLNNVAQVLGLIAALSTVGFICFIFCTSITYAKPFWKVDELKRVGFICLWTMIISISLQCVVPNTKQVITMIVGSADESTKKSIPTEFIAIYEKNLTDSNVIKK